MLYFRLVTLSGSSIVFGQLQFPFFLKNKDPYIQDWKRCTQKVLNDCAWSYAFRFVLVQRTWEIRRPRYAFVDSKYATHTYIESVGWSWLYLSDLEGSSRVKSALEPHGHSRPFAPASRGQTCRILPYDARKLHPAGQLWPVQRLDKIRPIDVRVFIYGVISLLIIYLLLMEILFWLSDI
jgi:hypothetical protein